jgi:hypothetical protein
MKMANLTAKVAGLKVNAVRVLAAATLAGTMLVAAVPAAQAQRGFVRFGGPRVFVGGPRVFVGVPPVVVAAPPVVVYGQPGFYGYGYGRFDGRFNRGFRGRR